MKWTPKRHGGQKIVLDYFQSEFEGICWFFSIKTILEQRAIVQICEINPTTPKTTNLRMACNFMTLESFRFSYRYRLWVFPGRWLPTWFTCTWSLLAKDLVAQSGSKKFLKLHLLWAVLWPVGFACFTLHRFSQISVRIALMFAISNNLMYTTSSTTKFCSFCKKNQVDMGASMWRLISLVEVTVKFGVLLAVPRNKAR